MAGYSMPEGQSPPVIRLHQPIECWLSVRKLAIRTTPQTSSRRPLCALLRRSCSTCPMISNFLQPTVPKSGIQSTLDIFKPFESLPRTDILHYCTLINKHEHECSMSIIKPHGQTLRICRSWTRGLRVTQCDLCTSQVKVIRRIGQFLSTDACVIYGYAWRSEIWPHVKRSSKIHNTPPWISKILTLVSGRPYRVQNSSVVWWSSVDPVYTHFVDVALLTNMQTLEILRRPKAPDNIPGKYYPLVHSCHIPELLWMKFPLHVFWFWLRSISFSKFFDIWGPSLPQDEFSKCVPLTIVYIFNEIKEGKSISSR